MAQLKTQPNDQSVEVYLNRVADEKKRRDCFAILELMRDVTQSEPRMWGDSIVGFGSYHYNYASGREGDWPLVGYSPRSQNMSLYIMAGFSSFDKLMAKLGKHKTGKSCLYIKRLDDVDEVVLRKLIDASVVYMRKKYATGK